MWSATSVTGYTSILQVLDSCYDGPGKQSQRLRRWGRTSCQGCKQACPVAPRNCWGLCIVFRNQKDRIASSIFSQVCQVGMEASTGAYLFGLKLQRSLLKRCDI